MSALKSVMPYCLEPHKAASNKLRMLNPNSSDVRGPSTQYREPQCVKEGLLYGWDAECVKALDVSPSIAMWDLGWTERESYWESEVHKCTVPEEVESLLPVKWFGYKWETEVDETLSRVCTLCTALVDKYLAVANSGGKHESATKWRFHEHMSERLKAIMELFEESIGEEVPMLKLRDPVFVRQCWEQLSDEDRQDVLSSLGSISR